MKLHHLPGSRSCRVRWLLEELGLEYELETHAFAGSARRSAAHREKHPLGLVPVLEDGEAVLFESGAIVQFVLERYGQGRLQPAHEEASRAAYLQWFHFGEASLAAPLTEITRNRFVLAEAKRSERAISNARERFARAVRAVEEALPDHAEGIVGAFSAADIMLGYALTLAARVDEMPAEASIARSYLERLARRPAYARAFAGGFGED